MGSTKPPIPEGGDQFPTIVGDPVTCMHSHTISSTANTSSKETQLIEGNIFGGYYQMYLGDCAGISHVVGC